MKVKRSDLGSELSRRVRQRCAYGCVMCRIPIYEYAHLDPHAKVQTHEYENLALLCPTCHIKFDKKKTISKSAIIARRAKVELTQEDTMADNIEPAPYTVLIGANLVETVQGYIFRIKGLGYLSIHFLGDRFSLNAEILDKNGNVALQIDDNELVLGGTTWDIDYVGSTITLRNALGDVFAKITIEVERRLIVFGGMLKSPKHAPIYIDYKGIRVGKTILAALNRAENCDCVFMIDDVLPEYKEGFAEGHSGVNCTVGNSLIRLEVGTRNISGLHNEYRECGTCFGWTTEYLASVHPETSMTLI